MDGETNPEGSRSLPVLPESSSSSSTCAICSLTPPFNPIISSHGELFCLSCVRYALIEKRQDEPAIFRDFESSRRREGDRAIESADGVDEEVLLVRKALSETRREQIQQLQQLEDNLEQLKTTLVCALGLLGREDGAWIDEAIAQERMETRMEMAALQLELEQLGSL